MAVINDTFEASPGAEPSSRPTLIAEAAPEVPAAIRSSCCAYRTVSTSRRSRTRSPTVHEGPVHGPLTAGAMRNVEPDPGAPFLMAGGLAVLAVASLVHALVLAWAATVGCSAC